MPVYTLNIAGVPQSMKLGSMHITEASNGRGSASVVVQTLTGTYRPAKGAYFDIEEDATMIFAGRVDIPGEAALADAGDSFETTVSAVDYNAYAGHRFIFNAQFPGGTYKAFLQWIAPYLTPYGIGLWPSQPTDAEVIPAMPFDCVSVEDALNQGSGMVNRVWDIGYDGYLKGLPPSSNTAPSPMNAITDWTHLIGDVTVEPIDSYYANYVYLRYSQAAVSAYGYLVYEWGAANATDGNTMTCGNTTYTFRNAPSVDHDVQIGVDMAASVQNLGTAISASIPAVPPATDPTPPLCNAYWMPAWGTRSGLRVVAVTPGVAGNNIAVVSTNADLVWRGNAYTGTISALENGTDQALTGLVWAFNQAEIDLRGLREVVLTDDKITDVAVAQKTVDNYVAKSVLDLKKAVYQTLQTGLHPGMTQTITLPKRNLAGTFTITDVEIYDLGDGTYARRVTVLGGTAVSYLWQDDAKKIFGGGGGGSSNVNIGGGGGGGSTTVLSSPFPLGGSRENGVICGTTPMLALSFNRFPAKVTQTLTASIETRNVGGASTVRITPGLYDITDQSVNGGWQWGTDECNHVWGTPQEFTVSVIAGHAYALGLKTDTAGNDGEGYVHGNLVP